MTDLADVRDEYEFLDSKDDRYRLLNDLGRALEPMPDPLKTDATLVRGCQSKVWTYPTRNADGTLHFLADSNSAITKGIIALILLTVQDKSPADIIATDIGAELAPFEVDKHLTSGRTSGLRSMIDKIRETAERYA